MATTDRELALKGIEKVLVAHGEYRVVAFEIANELLEGPLAYLLNLAGTTRKITGLSWQPGDFVAWKAAAIALPSLEGE